MTMLMSGLQLLAVYWCLLYLVRLLESSSGLLAPSALLVMAINLVTTSFCLSVLWSLLDLSNTLSPLQWLLAQLLPSLLALHALARRKVSLSGAVAVLQIGFFAYITRLAFFVVFAVTVLMRKNDDNKTYFHMLGSSVAVLHVLVGSWIEGNDSNNDSVDFHADLVGTWLVLTLIGAASVVVTDNFASTITKD